MKKFSFTRSMMALAMPLTLTLTACHSEQEYQQPSEAEAVTIAEKALGVTIDPDQSWNMTQDVTAKISVNIDYGEKYDVTIYSNDPLVDKVGYKLATGSIDNGGTFTAQVVAPKDRKSLMVGVANSKGYTYYKSVPVNEGKLDTRFGDPATTAPAFNTPAFTPAFAPATTPAFASRRSITAPSVPDITIPDANYVNTYLDGAKEPTAENTVDNYDNGYDVAATEGHWEETAGAITTWPTLPGFMFTVDPNWNSFAGKDEDLAFWNNTVVPLKNAYDNVTLQNDYTNHPQEYINTYNSKIDAFYAIVKALGESRKHWLNVWTQPVYGVYTPGSRTWIEGTDASRVEDPTYVRKFVINQGNSWNDYINVLESEGISDGKLTGWERTIVIKGTWNLNKDQKVGSRGQVIVASGGVLNIASGCTLKLVNQARLVIMPGATVQGAGNIMVTNGNDEGFENYNGGTINITGRFNNNFGKFFNYGKFYATQYEAGGQESNFYNHGVAHIKNGGTDREAYLTPNARIFNACQWYCEEDMRAYIIEMTSGSYFYVGGQLEMSCGTDGSNDPTYVAMAAGALMQVDDLDNNNTSWVGPTSGYAVVETGGISYLNWTGAEPITSGYFINNIAVSVDDPTVGAGNGQGTDTYVALRDYVLNGYGSTGNVFDPIGKVPSPDGNGGAVLVSKGGADLTLDASAGFVAGQEGCSPGYNGEPIIIPTKSPIYSYAFEDSRDCDYDLNDVVLKAYEDGNHVILKLVACGATLDLQVRVYDNAGDDGLSYGGNYITLRGGNGYEEIHDIMEVDKGTMVNTQAGRQGATKNPYTFYLLKENYDYSKLRLAIWVPEHSEEIRLSEGGQAWGTGNAPYGVRIPEDWKWPKEFINVVNAYPDFATFATDASNTTGQTWYKNNNVVARSVMDENDL